MTYFEDAFQMNTNLNRQYESFRGQDRNMDRMHDFANEQRLLNAMQMDKNERERQQRNSFNQYGSQSPQNRFNTPRYNGLNGYNPCSPR